MYWSTLLSLLLIDCKPIWSVSPTPFLSVIIIQLLFLPLPPVRSKDSHYSSHGRATSHIVSSRSSFVVPRLWASESTVRLYISRHVLFQKVSIDWSPPNVHPFDSGDVTAIFRWTCWHQRWWADEIVMHTSPHDSLLWLIPLICSTETLLRPY